MKTLEHLRGQTVQGVPLFEAQMITRLFLHSDNAAQHFNSSKSLHWLSKQTFVMDFASGLWDYGPPGHGKVHSFDFSVCSETSHAFR